MCDALRTLELQKQDDTAKPAGLRAAIAEGDASGIAEGNVFAEAWAEAGLPEAER